ncbi:hypothetical protein HNR26_002259 [Rhizobium rosettiformans]|jgi:hypothetical protein|uniref:Uncharacterized protein n=1 Tax=Rhizobium rosettiformans TaxID=1368430 RepID=A0A7W8MCV9_9HYPH|nr:hypothetical protein [Rhizobium rosettiformans]
MRWQAECRPDARSGMRIATMIDRNGVQHPAKASRLAGKLLSPAGESMYLQLALAKRPASAP